MQQLDAAVRDGDLKRLALVLCTNLKPGTKAHYERVVSVVSARVVLGEEM